MKDLGETKKIINIEIGRDRVKRIVYLSQKLYL